MSKSLKRVEAALRAAGLDSVVQDMGAQTRTAAQAAAAVGCVLDQIAKSIVFQGADTGRIVLFVTAGGRQVDTVLAAALAQEPLSCADPAVVRSQTGFAIGGVSPIGHLAPVRVFFDRTLLGFDRVWAAAGTPTHVFAIAQADLVALSNAQVADFSS